MKRFESKINKGNHRKYNCILENIKKQEPCGICQNKILETTTDIRGSIRTDFGQLVQDLHPLFLHTHTHTHNYFNRITSVNIREKLKRCINIFIREKSVSVLEQTELLWFCCRENSLAFSFSKKMPDAVRFIFGLESDEAPCTDCAVWCSFTPFPTLTSCEFGQK